jgi:hypothetical protein
MKLSPKGLFHFLRLNYSTQIRACQPNNFGCFSIFFCASKGIATKKSTVDAALFLCERKRMPCLFGERASAFGDSN